MHRVLPVLLAWLLTAVPLANAATPLQMHRAPTAATTAVNFGAKTRLGLGALTTTQTASSALTGTNNGDFKIDDISTLAPAASGAGTYGNAWTQTGGATSYTLTGVSGATYTVTIQTGKIHIATRNSAPTHPDNGLTGDTQLQREFALSTAAGGPALGDQILWRTGSIYNPTNGVWWIEPLSVASYTGSGRITVGSEFVDTALDANDNPRLQHGGKMGMVYFAPADVSAYPVDFKNIWWYTDQAVPTSASFFQYQNNSSGVGFYNCRIELGPDVTTPSDNLGLNLKGASVVDGCHLLNMGQAITVATGTVTGVATVSNNILEGGWDDGIHISGPGITVFKNFGFGWKAHVGNHEDPVQFIGSAVTTSLGPVKENIFGNDLQALVQSCFFYEDQTAGFLTNADFENNLCSMGNSHGLAIQLADAPVIKFNTILMDPFANPGTLKDNAIELIGTGQNGSTITGNAVNAVSVGTQPGVNTLDNALFPIGVKTQAQIVAMYQVAFPNYPNNNTDARWRNRAGWLNIWTPADLTIANGGVKHNSNGTFYGMLFPACLTQPNGALNDGSVYACDAAWLISHPAAS